MNKTFFFILFLYPLLSWGQEKYEKERRINIEEVPVEAVKFLQALAFDRKIKWYQEEGINRTSFEAKTKFQHKKYSIEFDKLGQIEDAEIRMDWSEIPKPTQTAIQQQLGEEFQKFKIKKIQVQYTGASPTLIQYLNDQSKDVDSITTKYEIIVKGKKKDTRNWYEFLFSQRGTIEKRSVIVFRNTDNLEF